MFLKSDYALMVDNNVSLAERYEFEAEYHSDSYPLFQRYADQAKEARIEAKYWASFIEQEPDSEETSFR